MTAMLEKCASKEEGFARSYEMAAGRKLVVPKWLYDMMDVGTQKAVTLSAPLPLQSILAEE